MSYLYGYQYLTYNMSHMYTNTKNKIKEYTILLKPTWLIWKQKLLSWDNNNIQIILYTTSNIYCKSDYGKTFRQQLPFLIVFWFLCIFLLLPDSKKVQRSQNKCFLFRTLTITKRNAAILQLLFNNDKQDEDRFKQTTVHLSILLLFWASILIVLV